MVHVRECHGAATATRWTRAGARVTEYVVIDRELIEALKADEPAGDEEWCEWTPEMMSLAIESGFGRIVGITIIESETLLPAK